MIEDGESLRIERFEDIGLLLEGGIEMLFLLLTRLTEKTGETSFSKIMVTCRMISRFGDPRNSMAYVVACPKQGTIR